MQAPWIIRWIAVILETLPAPTVSEASIVSGVAWPAVAVILVFRFRNYLRKFLDAVADRLPHDHVKIGPFEMTPASHVVPLAPDAADESTGEYDHEDIERIDKFFEFIAEPHNYDRLQAWIAGEISPPPEVYDFIVEPEYATARSVAFGELVEG